MNRAAKIGVVAALTLGIAGGVAAFGKHRHGDPEKMATRMIEHISEELDLTETQQASLEQLKEAMLKVKREMHPQSESKEDHHAQIRAMITADQFDQSKMIDMINRKAEIVQQNSSNVVAALGGFLDGLDAEQKNELAEKMEKKHRFGKRHGHRHGHNGDRGRKHGYDDDDDDRTGYVDDEDDDNDNDVYDRRAYGDEADDRGSDPA